MAAEGLYENVDDDDGYESEWLINLFCRDAMPTDTICLDDSDDSAGGENGVTSQFPAVRQTVQET